MRSCTISTYISFDGDLLDLEKKILIFVFWAKNSVLFPINCHKSTVFEPLYPPVFRTDYLDKKSTGKPVYKLPHTYIPHSISVQFININIDRIKNFVR